MGNRSRDLLALGALVLVLCVLATASGEGLRWTGLERDTDTSVGEQPEQRDDGSDLEEGAEENESDDGNDEFGSSSTLPFGRLTGLIVMGALVAVLIALLARLRISMRRKKLEGGHIRPTVVAPPPDPEDEEAEELAEALDAALGELAQGSPRNSIVAAWLRLEEAAESEHFLRNVADTPREFVERVLTSYALDGQAISDLAALYREARFSEHPITPEQRDAAADCLATLLDGIRTSMAGGRR